MQRITALIAAAAVAASAPAWAQMEQRSVRVSYADLDLGRAEGRKALDRRIEQAVDRICRDDDSIRDLVRSRLTRECRAGAFASVQPQLAALYGAGRWDQASLEVRAATAR